MLTTLLLVAATAATGTCVHLAFVNVRLRRINRELKYRVVQAERVNAVLRSRIEVLKAEANFVQALTNALVSHP